MADSEESDEESGEVDSQYCLEKSLGKYAVKTKLFCTEESCIPADRRMTSLCQSEQLSVVEAADIAAAYVFVA